MRFWFDVSGETRETAAQVVTFKQPAQTFYKWIKGFWPSHCDKYALGRLPISIDSLVLKRSMFFWSCQSDFMHVFQNKDHMPHRPDERKMIFQNLIWHLLRLLHVFLYRCLMQRKCVCVCVFGQLQRSLLGQCTFHLIWSFLTACCDSETWIGWQIILVVFSCLCCLPCRCSVKKTVCHSQKSCAPTHFLVSMFQGPIFMGTDIFFGMRKLLSGCIFFIQEITFPHERLCFTLSLTDTGSSLESLAQM